MSKHKFSRMCALPLAQLIKQPKNVLIAFANYYLATKNTELHIIPTGDLN